MVEGAAAVPPIEIFEVLTSGVVEEPMVEGADAIPPIEVALGAVEELMVEAIQWLSTKWPMKILRIYTATKRHLEPNKQRTCIKKNFYNRP